MSQGHSTPKRSWVLLSLLQLWPSRPQHILRKRHGRAKMGPATMTHKTARVQDRTSNTVVLPVVGSFRLMVTPALDKPNFLRSFTDIRRKSRLIQGLGKIYTNGHAELDAKLSIEST